MARSLLPFTLCMFGSCQRERASSTVNQFPSRMPSFFAPCRLVGKSSYGRQPYVDRAGCQQLILKMDSIPGDDRFIEGQAWL